MLSNIDIENICQRYRIPLVACVMKDELANLQIQDGGYVVNLASTINKDPSLNHGTHWLALIVKGNQACYFDSFGCLPPTEIIDFVKKREGVRLGYSSKEIQNIQSHMCGFFSIAFLYFILRSRDITRNIYTFANKFTKFFSDDTKKNDEVLREFYETYFKHPYPPQFSKLFKKK